MASEHEKLVEDVAQEMRDHLWWPDNGSIEDARQLAISAVAFIAERTKEPPTMPADAKRWTYDRDGWALLHAASALWPSDGTDGIEESGVGG